MDVEVNEEHEQSSKDFDKGHTLSTVEPPALPDYILVERRTVGDAEQNLIFLKSKVGKNTRTDEEICFAKGRK